MAGIELPGEDRLPSGPVRDLTVALHELYTGAGRPGLRRITAAIMHGGFDDTISHQTVSDLLNGRNVPAWSKVNCLAQYLADKNSPRQNHEKISEKFLPLWKSAAITAEPTLTSETSNTTPGAPISPGPSTASGRTSNLNPGSRSTGAPTLMKGALSGLWRDPATNQPSRELRNLLDQKSGHPEFDRPPYASRPSEMQLGIDIPSGRLGTKPSGAEIRRRFLVFLTMAPMANLVSALIEDENERKWNIWGSRGRGDHEAVLSGPASDETPSAWAGILLPDPWLEDGDSVTFVTGLRCRSLPLMRWHEPFRYALEIPDAFAGFVQELGIPIRDRPPTSKSSVGIRLRTSKDITKIVNIDDYERVPNSPISSTFDAYAISTAHRGLSSAKMAAEWIGLMCDYALHVDGYESALAALSGDEHAE